MVAIALALPSVAVASVQADAAPVQAAPAWTKPALEPLCAPNANQYSWTLTLTPEENQVIEFSWDGFAGLPTSVFDTIDWGQSGTHAFYTPRGGTTLSIRYASDYGAGDSAEANGELCTPEVTPSPTPEPTCQAPGSCSSPAPTPCGDAPGMPCETPSPTPTPSAEPTPSSSLVPPIETTNPTPRLTLPPTSTLAASPPSSSNGILAAGFVLATIAGSSLLLAGRKARQVR